jgi:uncharacterized membrane protein (TIGR02234 family)
VNPANPDRPTADGRDGTGVGAPTPDSLDRTGAGATDPPPDDGGRNGVSVEGHGTGPDPPGPAGGGTSTPPAARAGGRELAAVAALCAVGGGMVLFAVGPTWVEVVAHRASPLPDVTLAVSGRTLAPLVAGLGVVGLAGVVGLLATRRWGRLAVAAIIALSGLGVLVNALTRLTAPGQAEARDLLDDAGRSAGAAAVTATAHPGWPLLAAAGGLLLALGGLAALLRSRRWPTMSARYETPAARTDRPRTDAAVWDALDRGDDPTATP